MNVTSVCLTDFRNIERADVSLSPGVNIVEGLNAQGKSNFLESVYLCATGRSYRGAAPRELPRFGQAEGFARLEVSRAFGSVRIAVRVVRDGSKDVYVNNIPARKLGELFGRLTAVVFSPEDLRLVKAGPAERRRFMDMELCQLETIYYSDLRAYYKALKQRNSLLKTLRRTTLEAQKTLCVWDEQLAHWGLKIMAARAAFIDKLSGLAAAAHASMCPEERLDIEYRPSVPIDAAKADFTARLAKSAERDIALGATSIGAHKDDFDFIINNQDARAFASQGQNRTAALSLKLSEIELIRREKREAPVLLLDDVFSELDAARQSRLVSGIKGIQSIITCTGAETALSALYGSARRFTVCAGVITEA